jgi:predicted phosphodiesterase
MKLGIVSDLHTEMWKKSDRITLGDAVKERLKDADVILLAGDIGSSGKAIRMAKTLFPKQPVCIVAGNHEHDGYVVDDSLMWMTETARTIRNVHFLNRGAFTTDKFDVPLRVLGTTLWTDFNLVGTPHLSMVQAARFPDFTSMYKDKDHRIKPDDFVEWHTRDKQWLFAELDKPFDGVTVVMTHHAPVSFGLSPRYDRDVWNPCFASRLENQLIRDDLDVVVWGHTHFSLDQTIGRTRFVSSQLGYLDDKNQINGEFGTVIEVTR